MAFMRRKQRECNKRVLFGYGLNYLIVSSTPSAVCDRNPSLYQSSFRHPASEPLRPPNGGLRWSEPSTSVKWQRGGGRTMNSQAIRPLCLAVITLPVIAIGASTAGRAQPKSFDGAYKGSLERKQSGFEAFRMPFAIVIRDSRVTGDAHIDRRQVGPRSSSPTAALSISSEFSCLTPHAAQTRTFPNIVRDVQANRTNRELIALFGWFAICVRRRVIKGWRGAGPGQAQSELPRLLFPLPFKPL